jgi:hypothetical protein
MNLRYVAVVGVALAIGWCIPKASSGDRCDLSGIESKLSSIEDYARNAASEASDAASAAREARDYAFSASMSR